jgi:hypothetical protein
MTTLREIAHARAGDKGDVVNISVIAYRTADYEQLKRHVTAERVQAHLGDFARGGVRRYALPRIGALNFVISKALDGGVTRSAALDKHGKTLSAALLELELPEWET